jgi:phosphotransferase system HPr (HPr) family protein
MSELIETRTVIVTDPLGIHVRSALAIVQVARRGGSKVTIAKGTRRVDATEMLQVMTLAAEQGTELVVEAVGVDAVAVLDSLEPLFAGDMDETPEKGTSEKTV